ncbi:MAG: prolyl oligopeptidase family serine peptidase [Caulobacter sp.]
MTPTEVPFGGWSSPWSIEQVARGSMFPQFWVGQLAVDETGIYALTRRGEEGGRGVVLKLDGSGGGESLIPPEYNVRTQIIEYGGSGFVLGDGTLFFTNADQRWYRRDASGDIRPITAEGAVRYGAPIFDARRSRIICVREDHRGEGEPVNTIVAVNPDGDDFGTVLVAGDDFYAWPGLSPDGTRLVWAAWNNPHVPWDVTGLFLGHMDEAGQVTRIETVVAEDDEVACDPQFSPGGELVFVSDRSDWWNYYVWRDGQAVAVAPMALEFARPIWQLGNSDVRVIDDRTILGVYTEEGVNRLGLVDIETGALKTLKLPYTYFARLQVYDGKAYVLASAATIPAVVVEIDLATLATRELLKAPSPPVDPGFISSPTHIAFPSAKGRTGYGFLYMPRNASHVAPKGTLPPLLVTSHGGPTGCTNTCFNPAIQLWTSRGFAVFDINYAGSTGYGRPFRNLLKGGWGVVDVEDHVAAARHLAAEGLVDGDRLAVRGWSAGGYNAFACLAFADVFQAGVAYFGISDLVLFANETHKFEAYYTDYLVGPRETSQALFRERSPLYSADKMSAPLLMLQGALDKITPPNQSELILESLKRRGVPVGYILFEGEGHGFRMAETNLVSLQAELAFYGKVFGFEPAEPLPPLVLENADALPGGTAA